MTKNYMDSEQHKQIEFVLNAYSKHNVQANRYWLVTMTILIFVLINYFIEPFEVNKNKASTIDALGFSFNYLQFYMAATIFLFLINIPFCTAQISAYRAERIFINMIAKINGRTTTLNIFNGDSVSIQNSLYGMYDLQYVSNYTRGRIFSEEIGKEEDNIRLLLLFLAYLPFNILPFFAAIIALCKYVSLSNNIYLVELFKISDKFIVSTYFILLICLIFSLIATISLILTWKQSVDNIRRQMRDRRSN